MRLKIYYQTGIEFQHEKTWQFILTLPKKKKKWQSDEVFHVLYIDIKVVIFYPHMNK